MNKCVAILLTALLLFGVMLLPALAVEGTASAYATFVYDFSKGLERDVDYTQVNQIRIENKEGYVTFTAEGDDPYFRFADEKSPTPKTSDLAYLVITYRTTASIAAGEIYTNRRSGAHWGDPNTHVTWTYIPDGEWHTVVVDASTVWGNDGGDELYAFRLDPLSSGAKVGDSIDIASVLFFREGTHARAYAGGQAVYTATFAVDGIPLYRVEFREGDTTLEEPVVPILPGMVGTWEPYTLTGSDMTINAVYTPAQEPNVPEVPPLGTEAAPRDTQEPGTLAETEPVREVGCTSVLDAGAALVLPLVAAAVLGRKKRCR